MGWMVPRSLVLGFATLVVTGLPGRAWQGWLPLESEKLAALDQSGLYGLGHSVSVSGGTVAAGAPNANAGKGAVYLFERAPDGDRAWKQIARLTASDGALYDRFGTSTAISGDTVVAGATWHDPSGLADAGAAYVFERNQGGPNAWGQVAKLVASDARAGSELGWSAAASGDTVVVGTWRHDLPGIVRAGAAYVFQRNQGGPGAWGEVRRITAGSPRVQDGFGYSVAISGDTALVGAWMNDTRNPNSGAAHVFDRHSGGPNLWSEVAVITALDGEDRAYFGSSVGLDGDTAVVGAPAQALIGPGLIDVGSAYVYERNLGGPNLWGQARQLAQADWKNGDEFGRGVAISGDTILVGAWLDDHSGVPDAGSGYLFERDRGGPGAWGQVTRIIAAEPDTGDEYGRSVAIDGNVAVVGAWQETHFPYIRAGAAYVHENYAPRTYCTAGTTTNQCRASMSVLGTPSLSGDGQLKLLATGVEGNRLGLIFYGSSGRSASPWGIASTSFLCVKVPTQRTPPTNSGGASGSCNGSLALDWNEFVGSHRTKPVQLGLRVGSLVQAQGWFRDPPSAKSSSLSNAIEFQVGP